MHIPAIFRCAAIAAAVLGGAGCSTVARGPAQMQSAASEPILNFDVTRYVLQQAVVNGQVVAVRAYENIVYVAKPVDTTYEVMNIYIPDAYFHGQAVGGFSAQTAPIFLPNQVGGYMPAKPGTLSEAVGGPGGPGEPGGQGARQNTIAVALSKGYVVASPGARGRTTQGVDGRYTGKAPAAIVDLKAAVRYLRYNDARMPGDAEKIISNGTSAGGAMSTLLGATGNSADYEPYLIALGAAAARDDIFAVSAYCPITNLDNADSAYEWLFNGINDYKKIDISMLDFKVERKEVAGTLTADQVALSAQLKQAFPGYVNRLALRGPNGQLLALDASGNGSFKDYVADLVLASAQTALNAGTDLSALAWLDIQGQQVRAIKFDQYLQYAGRMKLPPAFDGLDLGNGENQLFGTATVDKQHFTALGAAQNAVAGLL
jgi:hypothetical protein